MSSKSLPLVVFTVVALFALVFGTTSVLAGPPAPPVCGANAHQLGNSQNCDCDTGYQGDPVAGCTLIVPTCGANAHQLGNSQNCACDTGYEGNPVTGCTLIVPTCGANAFVNANNACECNEGFVGNANNGCTPKNDKHLHSECEINNSEKGCDPGLVCTPNNASSGNGKCECGEGTHEVNGACVPDVPGCQNGQVNYGNGCEDPCQYNASIPASSEACQAPGCTGGQVNYGNGCEDPCQYNASIPASSEACQAPVCGDPGQPACKHECPKGWHVSERTGKCVERPNPPSEWCSKLLEGRDDQPDWKNIAACVQWMHNSAGTSYFEAFRLIVRDWFAGLSH